MESCNENVIEFLRNSGRAAVTFTQGRFVNKIKRLAKQYPLDVEVLAENADGSIFAHIPTGFISIRPPRTMSMTDEQREELRNRFKENISTTMSADLDALAEEWGIEEGEE